VNTNLLRRSHEKEEEGYAYHHNDKLITIFSASNYCGSNDNKVRAANAYHYNTCP
jgi:hypothetical protein